MEHKSTVALSRLAKAAASLEVFLSVGALGGGAALRLGPRGQIIPLPLTTLEGSAFHTCFVPGLILFCILGLGPLVAAALVWGRRSSAPLAVGVALHVWLASNNPPRQPFSLPLGAAITAVGVAWSRNAARPA